MKSDARVEDPKERPICSDVSSNTVAVKPSPSRFRKKSNLKGIRLPFTMETFTPCPGILDRWTLPRIHVNNFIIH